MVTVFVTKVQKNIYKKREDGGGSVKVSRDERPQFKSHSVTFKIDIITPFLMKQKFKNFFFLSVDRFEFHESDELLVIHLTSNLTAGEAKLSCGFSGILNDRLIGFYRSKYNKVRTFPRALEGFDNESGMGVS